MTRQVAKDIMIDFLNNLEVDHEAGVFQRVTTHDVQRLKNYVDRLPVDIDHLFYSYLYSWRFRN